MVGLINRVVQSVKNWNERRTLREGYRQFLRAEYRDLFRKDNKYEHDLIADYMFNDFMRK